MEFGALVKAMGEVGFPIAAAIGSGYFVFLTLKFILAGVSSGVKGAAAIAAALDRRVAAMNNDVVRIDTKVSHALGLEPDLDRISRAEQPDPHRE